MLKVQRNPESDCRRLVIDQAGLCQVFVCILGAKSWSREDSDTEVLETAKATDHLCNRAFTLVARSSLIKMECRTIETT